MQKLIEFVCVYVKIVLHKNILHKNLIDETKANYGTLSSNYHKLLAKNAPKAL